MVEIGNALTGVVGDIFSSTVTFSLVIAVILVIFGLVGGLVYYFFVYKKKFDIKCKIISTRAGEDKVYFDYAGILHNKKSNVSFLKLWNTKVKLELPRFDIFYHTNEGDYCEIERYSQRGFRFLTPSRIEKSYIVKKDGKLYPVSDLKQYPIEADITWILQREKENKKIIDPESFLMKLLSYMPQIVSGALMFMMLFVIFKYMPDMFRTMKEIITDLKKQTEPAIIEGISALLIYKNLWRNKNEK